MVRVLLFTPKMFFYKYGISGKSLGQIFEKHILAEEYNM